MAILSVDFPIAKGGGFHSYVSLAEGRENQFKDIQGLPRFSCNSGYFSINTWGWEPRVIIVPSAISVSVLGPYPFANCLQFSDVSRLVSNLQHYSLLIGLVPLPCFVA